MRWSSEGQAVSNPARLLAVLGALGLLLAGVGSAPVTPPTITGPFTFDNLSIFLLHGPDTLPATPVKSLAEALASGSAIVTETDYPDRIVVENMSGDSDLFIRPGDFIQCQRDSYLAMPAVILPPKSGRVELSVYCVSKIDWSGRWPDLVNYSRQKRGPVAGWMLTTAANADPNLRAKLGEYRTAFTDVLHGQRQVIGYAVAVNGKVVRAEVFCSASLLAKAWPEAITWAADEALAEKQEGTPFTAATVDEVSAFLTGASHAPVRTTQVIPPDDLYFFWGGAAFTGRNPAGLPRTRFAQVIPRLDIPLNDTAQTVTRPVAGISHLVSTRGTDAQAVLDLMGNDLPSVRVTCVSGGHAVILRGDEQELREFHAILAGFSRAGDLRPDLSAQQPPVTITRTYGTAGVVIDSRKSDDFGTVIHRNIVAR